MISVTLPIRVVNELNDHSHWRGRQKRAKEQNRIAMVAVMAAAGGAKVAAAILRRGGTVTLTRIAPRRFDSDGVVASMKHVRDGVADALGIDDGDERVEWHYSQAAPAFAGEHFAMTLAGRKYGVHIQIEGRP